MEAAQRVSAWPGKAVGVVTQDSRYYMGVLGAMDKEQNIVLLDAFERIVEGDKYTDLELGTICVGCQNLGFVCRLDDDAVEARKMSGEYKLISNKEMLDVK